MKDLVFSQAALLAGQLEERQTELLKLLCQGAVTTLEVRLRDGLTAQDCKADFVAAASLYALAALNEAEGTADLEEFRAGDLTVRRSGMDTSSRCLQKQADLIIQPFLKDCFLFLGV